MTARPSQRPSAIADGVTHWRENYDNFDIIDGTSWSLHIGYPDREVTSHGSNSYPGEETDASMWSSAEFMRYLMAIQVLLGGNDFA
jgi:hypothetical protein